MATNLCTKKVQVQVQTRLVAGIFTDDNIIRDCFGAGDWSWVIVELDRGADPVCMHVMAIDGVLINIFC